MKRSLLLWAARAIGVYLALWHFVFVLWVVQDVHGGLLTLREAFHNYLDCLLGLFIFANDHIRSGMTWWTGWGTAAILLAWFGLSKAYQLSRGP